MSGKKVLNIALLLVLLSSSLIYANASQREENIKQEPVADIQPPLSYYARKFFLFPLDLPSYAMRVVTLPVGAGLKFLQKKHVIDKTLDFLSNKDKTFWVYPIISGGAGNSFGGGVGMRHTDLFHKGYLTAASYRINLNQNQNAAISFGKPEAFEIFGHPLSYSFGTNFQRSLRSAYFGIGNDSSRDNEAVFNLYNIDLGATASYEVYKDLSIVPYIGYSASQGTNCGNGSVPGITQTFPGSATEGVGLWMQYLDLAIKAQHDTRDRLDYPARGGVRSLTVHHFQGMNRGGYNYNQYELDANQYIPLWKPRQILALHLGWHLQEHSGNDFIPFYRLSTLDASSPLRGFTSGRFRDRNYLLMNVEYRFPVWSLIDGAIFYDTGRVYHKFTDISVSNLRYSAGAGIRFRIPNLLVFRLDGAYGGEGINIIFGASRSL